MKDKGIGQKTAIIIVIVIVVAALAGGYLIFSERILEDDVSSDDYKTFTSEKYELSFEYPAGWGLEAETVEGETIEFLQIALAPEKDVEEIPEDNIASMAEQEIMIHISAGDLVFSPEDMKERFEELKQAYGGRSGEAENITFEGPENIERNGVRGVEFILMNPQGFLAGRGLPSGYIQTMIFEGENFYYYLEIQAKVEAYDNHESSLIHISDSFTPEK